MIATSKLPSMKNSIFLIQKQTPYIGRKFAAQRNSPVKK